MEEVLVRSVTVLFAHYRDEVDKSSGSLRYIEKGCPFLGCTGRKLLSLN